MGILQRNLVSWFSGFSQLVRNMDVLKQNNWISHWLPIITICPVNKLPDFIYVTIEFEDTFEELYQVRKTLFKHLWWKEASPRHHEATAYGRRIRAARKYPRAFRKAEGCRAHRGGVMSALRDVTGMRSRQSKSKRPPRRINIRKPRTPDAAKNWIGRDGYLIRKIEQATASFRQALDEASDLLDMSDVPEAARKALEQMKDASVLTREIHRDIEIDKEISDEVFRFAPPEGARLVEEFEVGP